MLVLLIMLIITIPVQTHAVKLNMAGGVPPPALPAAVSIDIDADGTLRWNGQTLEGRAELEQRLRSVAAQPTQPELRLRPDWRVDYGRVAMVMASAQRLGVSKIGLIGNEHHVLRR